MVHNRNGDWMDFGFGELFTFKNIFVFFIILVSASVFLWALFMRQGNLDIDRSLARHERHILIETLAEIPKGAFLHRVVDKELNKVCYLNAAGGGIKCFELDELNVSADVMEKLLKQNNDYRPRPAYNYSTYGYQKEDDDIKTSTNEE